MICGEANIHAEADFDFAVDDDRLLDCCSHRKDGCLWRIDDGIKGIDAPSTEVGYSDGAAVELVWLEFLILCPGGKIFYGAGDSEQGLALRFLNDRGDETIFHGDGDGEANVFEFYDMITGKGRIDRRNGFGRVDCSFQDEIVD